MSEPWSIFVICSPGKQSVRIHAGGKDICHIPAEWYSTENVSLICAAPDLLAACEQTEHNLRQGALCKEDLVALRAAIAKATGKEPQP